MEQRSSIGKSDKVMFVEESSGGMRATTVRADDRKRCVQMERLLSMLESKLSQLFHKYLRISRDWLTVSNQL